MPEKATDELAEVREAIRADRAAIAAAEGRLIAHLRRAVELGALGEDLAADTGYNPSRVSQLVGGLRKVRKAAGVPEPSPKRPPKDDDAPADCDDDGQDDDGQDDGGQDDGERPTVDDELPERYRAGALGRVRELLHADGLMSDRYSRPDHERATVFVHMETGEWWSPAGKHGHIPFREGSAAELLPALPPVVDRVYLVGPWLPGVTPELARVHGSEAAATRAWYLADVPGWTAAGHYLADADTCVGRWTADDPEARARTVEVQRAAVWFGQGTYGPREAAQAWAILRTELAQHFAGAFMMSTPGTTGREAWRRIIPKGDGFPVLSAELRELIQSTSGQGRRELIRHEPSAVPMVSQWDMRVAYAALTWGMPVGAPERLTAKMWQAKTDEEQAKLLMKRGRWLVCATVPRGWRHVGILPSPADGGRWCWPSRPGTTFTSWCSGSELSIARSHGWRFTVLEGMHFQEGKPLNSWKDKIMAIFSADRSEHGPELAGMLKTAARSMLLTTIGAFASRSHVVTKTAPLDRPDLLPRNRPIREAGGMYVWDELGERSAWMERSSHPEWSAEIWGRCRARLLAAPTADQTVRAGMLHVPVGAVIGCRTDGITLAGDPGWPDDGRPGRFRLVGRYVGELNWPQSDAEWSGMKDLAADAFEGGWAQ